MSRSVAMEYGALRALEAARAQERTNTPDTVTVKPGPNGTVRRSRRLIVKRCCDGCGEPIGDVTEAEMDRAVAGLPLLSVIVEHGCQEATA